ncbi:MAG: DUF4838 domain-containing protein [candidate division WS1 bacterium]|jgi:hypothetical protein|nr:DUF4838 domain-containing protein [candidate division WS1 bacterium]
MRHTRCFALIVALCCVCCTAASAAPFIVQNGQAQADIVISDAPSRTTRLAAEELQTYLRKISGAEVAISTEPDAALPVHLYVGRSAHTDRLGVSDEGLPHDAFRVVSGDNWLVLIGDDTEFEPIEPWAHSAADRARVLAEWDAMTGEHWGTPLLSLHRRYSNYLDLWATDNRGSFNAVNEFLRGLGCRWYFPGELGEIVPSMQEIELPDVNREVHPDFPVRHLYFYYNEFWTATEKSPRNVEDAMWQCRLGLRDASHEMGYSLGHGTTMVHSRDEVKQEHPEYFALWGGTRALGHHGGGGAPCLSSEGLLEENIRLVRTLYDHYDMPMVSVAPADGYVNLCQCELCEGKGTPDRGWSGQLSDYVWSYVNRVATELYQSHPDRMVSSIAYTTYQLPPEQIEQFSPNLAIILCRWRANFYDPATRESFSELVDAWLEKLPSKRLYIWDYYLHSRPNREWEAVPVYFPHIIAEDLQSLKGKSGGEYIEVFRSYWPDGYTWDALAANHLNCYLTARLYWDADQDVDALLEEYYDLFYGPAREEMRTFIEYTEANYMNANKDIAVIDRLFELLAKAEEAAGDGIYGQRVALLTDYMQNLHQLRERLAKGREDNPTARALTRNAADLKLDGVLDEAFWEGLPPYGLKDLATGARAKQPTTFKVAWVGNALALGITCTETDMANLAIGSERDGDANIWSGDTVEVLLETQPHSYYQIAISPTGAVVSADRARGIDMLWDAQAEVAAHRGDEAWSLEVRIPITDGADPLTGVYGRVPSRTYPWYFNVCRQRLRGEETALSAFSAPTEGGFHDVLKFAQLFVP